MLKTTGVDFSVANSVFVNEDSTIEKVSNSKIKRAKIGTKIVKFKNKSKSKTLIKFFLTKFQSFVQSSGSDFLSPKIRLAFTKLR